MGLAYAKVTRAKSGGWANVTDASAKSPPKVVTLFGCIPGGLHLIWHRASPHSDVVVPRFPRRGVIGGALTLFNFHAVQLSTPQGNAMNQMELYKMMLALKKSAVDFGSDEEGAQIVEYGLI